MKPTPSLVTPPAWRHLFPLAVVMSGCLAAGDVERPTSDTAKSDQAACRTIQDPDWLFEQGAAMPPGYEYGPSDCSAFAFAMMRQAGLLANFNRCPSKSFFEAPDAYGYVRIEREETRPGDVAAYPGHVGLVYDEEVSQWIHRTTPAPSSGMPVSVDDANVGVWISPISTRADLAFFRVAACQGADAGQPPPWPAIDPASDPTPAEELACGWHGAGTYVCNAAACSVQRFGDQGTLTYAAGARLFVSQLSAYGSMIVQGGFIPNQDGMQEKWCRIES